MVAKHIGGELISIPAALKGETMDYEADAIGLVFPVYGLAVPPIIEEFLERAEFHTPYLFAVITFGTFAGGAIRQLSDLLDRKGETLAYANQLHMQENYLPGFAMEKQKKPRKQDEKLEQICQDIHSGKYFVRKNSRFACMMTRTHQADYHYKRGGGVTQQLQISADCTHCGICEKICPTGNIQLEAGTPVYGNDCLSCLACIQNCPQKAIRLSNEKSAQRYRNPEIELTEIVQANQSGQY